MAHDLTTDTELEDRRNQVILAYIEAIEEGREPDRDQLLAENTEIRQDLEAFLAGHDAMARLTVPLRGVGRETSTRTMEPDRDARESPPSSLGEVGGLSPSA